jgi:predicted amidohydrolase YtcJ
MSALSPDLILHGGKIATMDRIDRFVSALAVHNGRIAAIGTDEDIRALAGAGTEVVGLEGRTAIPGIIDSHAHPDSYAARLASWEMVGPTEIASRAGLLARIAALAEARGPDDWIVCYRFDDMKSGGYPSLAEMDRAAQGRPLLIQRTDGHLCLANSRAFAEVGLGTDPPDPPFGHFDRDPATGAITGLCRETAAEVFLGHVEAANTPETIADGLERVFAEWRGYGITSVYNSLCGHKSIEAYQRLRIEGRLAMRVGIIVSGREEGLVESFISAGIRSGFGDDWLRVIGVEWCPDCSTSGRTAAYYEPYIGDPVPGEPQPNTGMLLHDGADLAARAVAAHKAGLQVMIEGVGDRGIDFALDAIESCLAADPRPDHRMRVEHCCCVTPPILERLKRLQVIDSSATGFMYDLGGAYIANRGQSAMRHMWPHRSLIDAGVPASGHSDAMVCQANPFLALWSMVTRRSDDGGDLDQRQAVSRTEALRAYTTLGAYSGREEAVKGSIEPGKLADIAILDRDYFTCHEDEIRSIRVHATVLDGDLLHHT